MDIEFAEQYGEALLDYSFDMLWRRETCGVNHAEFIFVRLANLLKEHAGLKQWFVKNLDSTINNEWLNLVNEKQRPNGFMPCELIEYIAHVMKWHEFEERAIAELEKHRDNQIYLMSRNLPASILEALKDDWEDIDMYESLQ